MRISSMALGTSAIRAIGILGVALGGGLVWAGSAPVSSSLPPVFAYYIASYTTPSVSGAWSGWFEVISRREIAAYEKTKEGREFLDSFRSRSDLRRSLKWYLPEDLSGIPEGEEARNLITSALTPIRSPYDSTNVEVIKAHLAEAVENGISGFIINWEGKGTQSDRAAHLILNNAPDGFNIALLYSFLPADGGAFQDDLMYLSQRYFTHTRYWKSGGYPVIILSASTTASFPPAEWIDLLRKSFQTIRFTLFGDTANPPGYADLFNGMVLTDLDAFVNNPTGVRKAYKDNVLALHSLNRAVCLPVYPGYLRYRAGRVLPPSVKRDVKRFAEDLSAAVSLRPDCIVVFSYNDWRSGTAIEPNRQESDAFLRALRDTLAPPRSSPALP